MVEQLDEVDVAVAAFREEVFWTVQELDPDDLDDAVALTEALQRLPGDAGAIGMVAVDEDWFLLVRVAGDRVRLMLSDATAADAWDLAASALEELGLPEPEEDDEQAPAGDLDLLSDLGVTGMDLSVLVDDFDLLPDEILSDVARRLGFGPLFDEAVGASP